MLRGAASARAWHTCGAAVGALLLRWVLVEGAVAGAGASSDCSGGAMGTALREKARPRFLKRVG